MDVKTMQSFFALLTIVAMVAAVSYLVVMITARSRVSLRSFAGDLYRVSFVSAWLVAATCMAGSLYFSETANYEPCRLCWYQRTMMYPLAILLLVGLLRRSREFTPYAVTLAVLGVIISSYHYLVEWYPNLESDVCDLRVPCTTVWFREFGFISLPFMALTGFITIITLLTAHRIVGDYAKPSEEKVDQ